VKHKCGNVEMMLGRDIFSLCNEIDFDEAFMMDLIIIPEEISLVTLAFLM